MTEAMGDWKEDLARRLRAARGLESQGRLAGRSGVSDRTIGLIEQAGLKRAPSPVTVARLALATGRDPTEWLACAGLTMRPEDIDALRDDTKGRARLDRLEPPDVIKRDVLAQVDAKYALPEKIKADIQSFVRDYVDRELVQFKKASDLWRDLTEYVDARILALDRAIRDVGAHVEQIAERQRELTRDIQPLKGGGTERRRK